MLRTLLCIALLLGVPATTFAQSGEQGRVKVAVVTMPKAPQNMSPIVRVQDPYCKSGTGSCSGYCNDIRGSSYSRDCPKGTLPCYTDGRCACVSARKCS